MDCLCLKNEENTIFLNNNGTVTCKDVIASNNINCKSLSIINNEILRASVSNIGAAKFSALSIGGTTNEVAYIRSSGAANVESLFIGTNYVISI